MADQFNECGANLSVYGRTDWAIIGAGLVGESIAAISIPSTAAVPLTSGVDSVLSAFDMPVGQFLVIQRLSLICSAGTILEQVGMGYDGIATINVANGRGAIYPYGAAVNDTAAGRRPTVRNISFSNLGTIVSYNFLARAIFSGGTVSAYGNISLKRLATA